jgi:hypothetical protein
MFIFLPSGRVERKKEIIFSYMFLPLGRVYRGCPKGQPFFVYKLPDMANGKLNMLREFVESLNTRDRLLIESVLEAVDVFIESEEEAAADASRAAESIANIDKSIGLAATSAEALKNAQQHRVEAARNSPLATGDEKSNIENQAVEKTAEIQRSADAKTAELNERKRAIEANLAARQAENGK